MKHAAAGRVTGATIALVATPFVGAAFFGIAFFAAMFSAPEATALPDCADTSPSTRQCERGAHVQINTSPNVSINDGPFVGQPWLFPTGTGAFGGWTLP